MLTVLAAAIIGVSLSACSSDDDGNGGSGSQSFLVGEWLECDALGNFGNDATGTEVMHMKIISSDKGEWWSVTKGKKDSHWYSFDYTYTLSGSYLELTLTITASSNPLEIGESETILCTYINGILHGGDVYYKKLGGTDVGEETGGDYTGKSYTTCPDDNHPHMIDLGLTSGTKWACCNVGANTPEEYGNYYAWGEINTKEVYNSDTYLYNVSGNYIDIGSDISGTKYDAATVNWGSPWHMPTKEQITELSSCKSVWTTRNGVKGREFTGQNGSTIFLPAAGYHWNSNITGPESGYYWSSTLSTDSRNDLVMAWNLFFYSGEYWTNLDAVQTDRAHNRLSGLLVRPVR